MNEATTTEPADLKGHIIKYGILIAVINIIIILLVYIIDVTLLVSFWMLLLLVVNIGLLFYAGFQWRKENGGFLEFKSAFIATFLVMALAGLIGVVFQILLYNVIDPELPEILADASAEQAQAMMESFGAQEDQMDVALEKARADTAERLTIGGMFKSYLWGLLIYAVMALIIGAIIKKKRPEFE